MEKKLIQERLKELLIYDELLGVFCWIKKSSIKSRIKIGGVAGCKKKCNYIYITIDDEIFMAHRLAWLYMEGYFPENEIDHINRCGHDNRWCNLRTVSHSCNMRNRGKLSNNKSGVTGVCWNKKLEKWDVRLMNLGDHVYCGSYEYLINAVKARWDAEVKYGFPNCNSTSSAFKWLKEAGIVE